MSDLPCDHRGDGGSNRRVTYLTTVAKEWIIGKDDYKEEADRISKVLNDKDEKYLLIIKLPNLHGYCFEDE